MKKKIIIIGYGSIGKKYHTILKKYFSHIFEILVLYEKLNKKTINQLKKKILTFNPENIILCTPSYLHFEHLKLICNNFSNKTILCEKPLFLNYGKLNINNNKVFVGYNLRFHPVILKAREVFKKTKVDEVYLHCSTNMPDWRQNLDKKKNYSFFQKKSGGVLYELSHEIDYFTWIFGNINRIFSFFKKLSKLKINIKDTFFLYGYSNFCKKVVIYLDMLSKNEQRFFIIKNKDKKLIGDLKKNNVQIFVKDKCIVNKSFPNFDITNTYKNIIQDIFLNKNKKISCNFEQGLSLVETMELLKR